jgi:hypothetical protein
MHDEAGSQKIPMRLSFKYEEADYVHALNAHHGSFSITATENSQSSPTVCFRMMRSGNTLNAY